MSRIHVRSFRLDIAVAQALSRSHLEGSQTGHELSTDREAHLGKKMGTQTVQTRRFSRQNHERLVTRRVFSSGGATGTGGRGVHHDDATRKPVCRNSKSSAEFFSSTAGCTDRTTEHSKPVRLSRHSEPQPDLALLRPRSDFYVSSHPGPQDVLLLVEVAETSTDFDRQIKLPLYAKAGIPEV